MLYLLQLVEAIKFEPPKSALVAFLIQRSAANHILCNYFYWYCDNQQITAQLLSALDPTTRLVFTRQRSLVDSLVQIASLVQKGTSIAKKIEILRSRLSEFENFEAMPLVLDPRIQITGIVPSACSVFKSTMAPLKLVFACSDGSIYPVMFKCGDDLRQDQLVVQIITLMEKLLAKENLDLALSPYKVLATGPAHGMLQFVQDAEALSAIIASGKGLDTFLGNAPEKMDIYVRSCGIFTLYSAGYCVITYILGVGDRHLDNLMLSTTGHMFHVDFGFILGRDPKVCHYYSFQAFSTSYEAVQGNGRSDGRSRLCSIRSLPIPLFHYFYLLAQIC